VQSCETPPKWLPEDQLDGGPTEPEHVLERGASVILKADHKRIPNALIEGVRHAVVSNCPSSREPVSGWFPLETGQL
jgi:hypothetical protein